MAFTLGGRNLPDPTQQMEANKPVKGVGLHKRAYGRIEISTYDSLVKNGDDCKCNIRKIESQVTGSFSQMFSVEGGTGGRLAPKPSIESISVSNDGGQDMSDAMLFQADIALKVYSKDDFDDIDVAFMTPRRKVKITIGYVGDSSYVLQAEITGFNFTINSDLSYDVSLKATGATDGLIEVDYTTLRKGGPTAETYEDPADSRKQIKSTDVITNFLALMAKTTIEITGEWPRLDVGGDLADGSARYKPGTGILAINHQMASGIQGRGIFSGFDMNDNVVSYVSLQKIIDDLNLNAATVAGIPDVLYDTSELTLPSNVGDFASGDPVEMIFGWKCKYGDTDYANSASEFPTEGQEKNAKGIWISQPLLQQVFDELKKPPGKEDAPARVSTSTFLKKIFNAISANSGGLLNFFLYADANVTTTSNPNAGSGFFLVLNKGTAASKAAPPKISIANGYEKGIRNVSLTSNLDSELIGMATAAAMTGEGGAHLNALFGDCYPESQTDDDDTLGESATDLKKSMDDAYIAIGDRISDSEVSQCKQAMKAYVSKLQKKTNPVIPYGLECELTCDGMGGQKSPRYGDAFQIDRLPGRLGGSNVFFAVTKIGQDFSGGDWKTNISGLMMIKAT